MNEFILHAGQVLTGFDGAGDAVFLAAGALHVRDGRIAAVGTIGEIHAPSSVQTVAYRDGIVLPGLINSHHHVGLTPLQMGSLDFPLELWIGSNAARRQLAPYLDTLFSSIELLKSGVTTVQHIQGAMPGPADHMYNVAREVLRAYDDVGMRVSFCFNARNQNRLAYEPDEAFVARLPDDVRSAAAAYIARRTVTIADYLDLFDRLRADTGANERIRIQLAPANLHWCSDDALLALHEKAVAADVPMHMHLLETRYQRDYARRRTGTTAVRFLERLGVLGPRMTLGHGTWMDEGDIEIAAATGTCICHNCSSNLRLGSGRAPVVRLLERGVPVALGIDEAGINDDRDMLLEMRVVLYQHRAPGIDARWPTPSEVLRMVTEGGARTVASARPLGRLAPGASADLVVMNRQRLFHPYQDEGVPLVAALVQRARAAAIEAVYVGGNMVVRNGRLTTIDEDAVLAEIAEHLARPRNADEIAAADFARRIVPHLRAFYGDPTS
jgi:cytosine/adenosine deaminase-related metal-dependent hydrolase